MSREVAEERLFKCIGLNENAVIHWNENFKVGNTYKLDFEALDDVDEHLRHIVIPLIGENGKTRYVDRDQFKDMTTMDISLGDLVIRIAVILFFCLLAFMGSLYIINRI